MRPYAARFPSFLVKPARLVVEAGLIWPLPLLVAGLAGVRLLPVAGIVLALALLPWPARLILFSRPTRPTPLTGPLLLLAAAAGLSMWASYDPLLSLPVLLTLLGSVSLFFALANASVSPVRVAQGLAALAVLVALYFTSQYGHFAYRDETGPLAGLARLFGAFMPNLVFFVPHPNAVAGFLAGIFFVGPVFARQAQGRNRWLWVLAVLLLVCGLLLTGSRGAWVGLAVAAAIWGVLQVPRGRPRVVLAGLAAVTGLVIAWTLFQAAAVVDLPFLGAIRPAAAGRLSLYRNSAYLLGDYLFTGIGPGDVFAMVYSRYQLLIPVPFLTYAHNLYLAAGLAFGLPGLAALGWLVAGFYRFVWQVESTGLDSRARPVFRAAWLGVTATLVHGLTDAPQLAAPAWTMPSLFALLALSVMLGRPAANNGVAGHSSWWWAAAVVAAVLVGVPVMFWKPALAAWHANLGALAQTRADLSPGLSDAEREALAQKAIARFERALQLNPSQPAANRRFGLMALERQVFDVAGQYLGRAYRQEPGNQATLKGLGYAYLWTGRLDDAEALLRRRDDRSEVIEELGTWSWWWGTQNRPDLSAYALEMSRRLSGPERGSGAPP